MTLGDCIKEYRKRFGMSQRRFSDICGLSNAYISILEKNVNPKTQEPPVPSYGVFQRVASAMGISVHELMEKANDSQVSLGSSITFDSIASPFDPELIRSVENRIEATSSATEKDLLSLFSSMTDSDKDKLLDYARYIVDSYKRPDKRRTK